MESCSHPYMTGRTSDLPMEEVLAILRRECLDESKVISLPPVLPKGGDVFVYCSSSPDPKHEHDYRFDRYRWVARGSNFHRRRLHLPTVLKRYYCLKDPAGSWKDSLLGFKKHIFCLRECTDPRKLYIIHYLGDETLHQPSSHGNRKHSKKPFTGTTKKVLPKIKIESKSHKKPLKAYKDLQMVASLDSSHRCMAIDHSHNLKWVQNASYKLNQKKQISNDEIFNIVELSCHLENFIMSFTLVPNVTVSFAHPGIIAEAEALLSLSSEDVSLPQLVSYDTTFKLGDFYLSPIVIRNIILEGDPILPVAFLLHTNECTAYHVDFLCEILSKLGGDNMEKIPFVIDRESGVVQPLEEKFPQIPKVYCRNHILGDVTMWVKAHGGKKDDLIVLTDNVTQLLKSSSNEQYQKRYGEYSVLWSQPFKEFFDKELKDCIPKYAAKFHIEKFAAFRSDQTATNNISESMNKMIKDEMDWTDIPVDAMALTMYYMQTYFFYEFKRAYCGLGNYSLKMQFLHLQKSSLNVDFPLFYPLETIIENIKSTQDQNRPRTGVEKPKNCHMSQIALAKLCKDSGGVAFCSQSGTFTVRDVHSNKMQAVTLYPQPAYCSCRSTGQCYHVIAVQMSICCMERVDKEC
ncbi:uncharacterized protein LOC121927141 [Sceloporus undulatus]|uniref:uncharacterized protein LOC121927141 n=1 Tax=Sceloporus undulatus TaxID=8520 RepID=UPI001C4A9FC1|nr:uncharacterized protein LOC121927141 [Sceloporus undulatus]XP_042316661.1 uncharacterized protein LOC121927141 [Sceloporus undulatus]